MPYHFLQSVCVFLWSSRFVYYFSFFFFHRSFIVGHLLLFIFIRQYKTFHSRAVCVFIKLMSGHRSFVMGSHFDFCVTNIIFDIWLCVFSSFLSAVDSCLLLNNCWRGDRLRKLLSMDRPQFIISIHTCHFFDCISSIYVWMRAEARQPKIDANESE